MADLSTPPGSRDLGATPLISCIVPVYNGQAYLGEALASIFGQSYRPLEVIVVDDGSTDGTQQVLAEYADRVTCLWQPNAGPAAARNLGVEAMQGEFVAFLDADDLWHPEKLARQMARFQDRPELELSLTHVTNFCPPELVADETWRDPRYHRPWQGYACQTLLTRAETFRSVGQFDPALRLGEDIDWFLRAREQGRLIELLPDVLVHRRLHQHNLTRAQRDEIPGRMVRLLRASLDRRRRGRAG
jgi:glycosyltransferase involved in cell wall biosynthesis